MAWIAYRADMHIKTIDFGKRVRNHYLYLANIVELGKIFAQPHTIVKQICFPNGDVLFLSLSSLSKNWIHNVGWGCAEILPSILLKEYKRKWRRSSVLFESCNKKGNIHDKSRLFPSGFSQGIQ